MRIGYAYTHIKHGVRVQLLPLILDLEGSQAFLGHARVSSTIARLQSRRKQFRLLSSSIKRNATGAGLESVFCQGNSTQVRKDRVTLRAMFPSLSKGWKWGRRLRDIDIAMSMDGDWYVLTAIVAY